jgi:hypothetical protein
MKAFLVFIAVVAVGGFALREESAIAEPGAEKTSAESHNPKSGIIVQNQYYAYPGKADELYQWLLDGTNLRSKLGFARGRVFRPMTAADDRSGSDELPDVVWEGEYADVAARERDFRGAMANPEFQVVHEHMDAFVRRFTRATYSVSKAPPNER